ncbi:MAG: biopolymer transport protein ExbD [Enterobacterales bacterium]|jgi:biopolymer transport protein ExbD
MFNKSKRSRRKKQINTDLDVTAFMNLMVVLIPFLLITAVFSQVTILKLNLPGGDSSEQLKDEKPPMQLEVILRKNRVVLAERNSGVISEFPLSSDDIKPVVESFDSEQLVYSPFVELNKKLQIIKASASDATTITILAEPDTSYDLIIQAMDAVRMIVPKADTDDLPGELFPDVSIGSAPIDPNDGGK